jgi:hypothetical protein
MVLDNLENIFCPQWYFFFNQGELQGEGFEPFNWFINLHLIIAPISSKVSINILILFFNSII